MLQALKGQEAAEGAAKEAASASPTKFRPTAVTRSKVRGTPGVGGNVTGYGGRPEIKECRRVGEEYHLRPPTKYRSTANSPFQVRGIPGAEGTACEHRARNAGGERGDSAAASPCGCLRQRLDHRCEGYRERRVSKREEYREGGRRIGAGVDVQSAWKARASGTAHLGIRRAYSPFSIVWTLLLSSLLLSSPVGIPSIPFGLSVPTHTLSREDSPSVPPTVFPHLSCSGGGVPAEAPDRPSRPEEEGPAGQAAREARLKADAPRGAAGTPAAQWSPAPLLLIRQSRTARPPTAPVDSAPARSSRPRAAGRGTGQRGGGGGLGGRGACFGRRGGVCKGGGGGARRCNRRV